MESLAYPTVITLWLALFPITSLLHFAEEYWVGGGYPAYLMRLRGVHLSTTRFIALQTVGLALLIAAGIISTSLKFPELMLTILGAFVFCNGLSHAMTAFRHRGYGPGLFTSVLIWIPLGAFTLITMGQRLSLPRFVVGTLVGFSVNGLVGLISMRGGRLIREARQN